MRQVIEGNKREIGEEIREAKLTHKAYRKQQEARFLHDQLQRVDQTKQQLTTASVAVETIKQGNQKIAQEMRMNLRELKGSMQLERSVHALKGRRLVDHARNVQSSRLLERQLSARGKKQSAGARTKEERAMLSAKRVSLKAQEAEMKRQVTARVKADLAADTGQSRDVDLAEKNAAADFIRHIKQQGVEKRTGARCASLATGSRLETSAVPGTRLAFDPSSHASSSTQQLDPLARPRSSTELHA